MEKTPKKKTNTKPEPKNIIPKWKTITPNLVIGAVENGGTFGQYVKIAKILQITENDLYKFRINLKETDEKEYERMEMAIIFARKSEFTALAEDCIIKRLKDGTATDTLIKYVLSMQAHIECGWGSDTIQELKIDIKLPDFGKKGE